MNLDPDMKILIVDDFSTMRRIIKNTLRQIGFSNVVEADDGKRAVTILDTDKIDLIISDWNMAEMTGIELLRHVRGSDIYKDTPFLMVTAEAQQQNIIEAVQAGVSNYVVKPFTADVIQEKIQQIFYSKN